jgi:hypothetical protein
MSAKQSKAEILRVKEQARQAYQPGKQRKEYEKPVLIPPADDSLIRPQVIVPKGTNRMVAWILFAAVLIVYGLTQARSLSFWDSGEYSTCMSILGVPHPPGNPFYIVLGRAVIALFGGFISHAFIAAFLSGLASAFAVMLTYLITVQLVSMMKVKAWESIFAGLIAGLFTAFSYTFWMNAIEAEVYAGLALFVNLIIWLTLNWVQKSRDMDHQNVLLLIIYLFFLGFCVHQTALQVAPAALFIVVYPLMRRGISKSSFWPKVFGYTVALILGYVLFGQMGKAVKVDAFDQWGLALVAFILLFIELWDEIDPKVWWLAVGLVFIGLSSHLYLMVRASARPFINEGQPNTLERFQDYVLRKQYGETSFFKRRGSFFGDQLGHHFLRYFGWQWFNADSLKRILSIPASLFGTLIAIIAGVVGAFGAWFEGRRNKKSILYILSIMICAIVSIFIALDIFFGWHWINMSSKGSTLNIPASLIKTLASIFAGALGVFGAWFQGKRNKHSFAYFFSIILCTTILMVFAMNISNQEVRDRDYFFVVAYNMWAIWMGIGALGLLYMLKQQKARIALAAVLMVFPVVNFVSQYFEHDRSREFIALDYGVNFLNSLEENAIIFTNGDNDTFPIWYAQAVADHYAKEYTHKARDVYPDDPTRKAIASAMDFKNKTLKGIRKDVSVANLSLLNTPWYIRQLRDREGILFDWTDEQIENLQHQMLPQKSMSFTAGEANPQMSFSIPIEQSPTWREKEQGYRVSDLAVLQIVKDNFGKRPIYFAVTCESMIGFEDHVRNEGMVNRVVHTKRGDNEQVDIERMLLNVDKIYQYRSIHDPKVFKDENMMRLTMNYGAAYVRAASYFLRQKDIAKAEHYRKEAEKYIKDPFRMLEFYTQYYPLKGDWAGLDNYLSKYIYPYPDGPELFLQYLMRHLETAYPEKVLEYYKKGMLQYPDNDLIAKYAVSYAVDLKQTVPFSAMLDSIAQYLEYPTDEMRAYLTDPEGYRRQAEQAAAEQQLE